MPKCVHEAQVAGGLGHQSPPGNVSNHPEPTKKYQQPSITHQDITMTVQHAPGNNSNHPLGSNSKGPQTKLSFISKDQFQIFPLLILAPPPKKISNKSPCGILSICKCGTIPPPVASSWWEAVLNKFSLPKVPPTPSLSSPELALTPLRQAEKNFGAPWALCFRISGGGGRGLAATARRGCQPWSHPQKCLLHSHSFQINCKKRNKTWQYHTAWDTMC